MNLHVYRFQQPLLLLYVYYADMYAACQANKVVWMYETTKYDYTEPRKS